MEYLLHRVVILAHSVEVELGFMEKCFRECRQLAPRYKRAC